MAFGNYSRKYTYILVKFASSEAIVERDRTTQGHIPKLSRLRLFDVLVMFDHLLDEDVWRLDLKMLGIDITIVPLQQNSLLLLSSPRLFAPVNYVYV